MPPKFQAGIHLAAKPGRSQTMNHLHLQPTGCRLGLPTWRSSLRCPTWVRVKAGKTKTYGHRHLVSPITRPTEHTFDPRVKSGQTGSNQKTNFWHLQPADCRPGHPTRCPCIRCRSCVRVKAGKTRTYGHGDLVSPFTHLFCAFPFDLVSRIYRTHSCFQC